MTSRERVLAVLNRQKPDKIPKDLSWGLCPAKYEEFRLKTGQDNFWEYFQLDVRFLDFAPTRLERDFSTYFTGRDGERGFSVDEWGVGSGKSMNEALHFEHLISPLQQGMTVEQAAQFPLPDFTEPYRSAHFASTVAELHERGLAVCGILSQTIFERGWAIRGFEETLMDMLADPEAIGILFDRITALRIEQARLLVDAGVDVLMLGDDVGMQTGMLMHADTWREHLKPRLAKVIAAATEIRPELPIFYHSCGNATDIIPDLIEIGVTVLNPLQPECVDHQLVKRLYGDRLAFWGGVSAQRNLSFGTPEQVRAEVKACIEALGHDGGYFIGPNHLIQSEVPWENILAYMEAVEEFGRYD